MAISAHQQQARLILCKCMVQILRPCSDVDRAVPLNERLVGYAIGECVHDGKLANLYALAKATGLPRSTVRGVIQSLIHKGWVIQKADKSFDFSTEFHQHADAWFGLPAKYQAVMFAGAQLLSIGAGQGSETDL